ncbi:MAG: prepilin-type N-terminal cleavage/methylation domain-containing protein [Plesiomonas shigelloides]
MQKGMTLIELLVTLTVASVLLAVAIPSYDNVRKSQELKNNTEMIFAFVEQVMQKAKRSNKEVTFFLSERNGIRCIGASDLTTGVQCDCFSYQLQCKVNDIPSMLNDISTMVSFNGLDGNKRFEYSGVRSTMLSGNITISNKYGSAKLVFSNYGRMRVCSVDGAGGYMPC